jgi:hypothetical protein
MEGKSVYKFLIASVAAVALAVPAVHGGDKPGHWIVGDVPMRAV